MRANLPLRVRGYVSKDEAWTEITQTEDLSFGGCGFYLRHSVSLGSALHLSLPLPKHLRQYDINLPAYAVYALVRFISGPRVGVMFLGKNPPPGFVDNPQARFLFKSEESASVREFARHDVALNIRLRRLLPGAPIDFETTVTENLSLGGAMVLTGMPLAKDEVLELENAEGTFKTRATVQAVSIGPNNVPRVSLRFTDPDAPKRAEIWLRKVGLPIEVSAPSRELKEVVPVRFRWHEFPDCAKGAHQACVPIEPSSDQAHVHLCSCKCHTDPAARALWPKDR
jgi:hypothetical protein